MAASSAAARVAAARVAAAREAGRVTAATAAAAAAAAAAERAALCARLAVWCGESCVCSTCGGGWLGKLAIGRGGG